MRDINIAVNDNTINDAGSMKMSKLGRMKSGDFQKGDPVRYVPMHAQPDLNHKCCENGVVSSVSDRFVFVRYYRDGLLKVTPEGTDPRDLVIITSD